jgi:hypothetical protein
MADLDIAAERVAFEAKLGGWFSLAMTWGGAEYAEANTAGAWTGWLAAKRAAPTLPKVEAGPDTERMNWLEQRDHVHALQWRCGHDAQPVKTSIYTRDRQIVGEGPTLRAAIDAARLQARQDGEGEACL